MKKTIYLFALLILAACINNEKSLDIPKEVIITGKVENYDPNNPRVGLAVNRIGLESLQRSADLDSQGNFKTSFESYIPTDIWIGHKRRFLILSHPGDSIHLIFDGSTNDPSEIIKTAEFSGDAAESNLQAGKFQQMYYSNPLSSDWNSKKIAKKEYEVDQYLMYLDTLQRRADTLYSNFEEEVSPNKEVQAWAKTYIEQDYYNALASYPMDHLRYNNLNNNEWGVPDDYYNALLSRLPITNEMLISGHALSNFITNFRFIHKEQVLIEETKRQTKTGESIDVSSERTDSLTLKRLIEHTPDPLLRQMVLTDLLNLRFKFSDISIFEKYEPFFRATITEPFLIEPLLKQYRELKEKWENPTFAPNTIFKEIKSTSAKEIVDSIVSNNKGKVIYINCWTTTCGFCIADMPSAKNLMGKMNGKDVAFVFMCLNPEEKTWKTILAEQQLAGQHYSLTEEQTINMQKGFDFKGVPYSFLINKQGAIVDKGHHLKPDVAEAKIGELLVE